MLGRTTSRQTTDRSRSFVHCFQPFQFCPSSPLPPSLSTTSCPRLNVERSAANVGRRRRRRRMQPLFPLFLLLPLPMPDPQQRKRGRETSGPLGFSIAAAEQLPWNEALKKGDRATVAGDVMADGCTNEFAAHVDFKY